MPERAVILLVEDNQDDVSFILRAFKRAEISNPIYAVADGEEAMAYLSGEGDYSNRTDYPLPELILLDLNLPGTDGFQVLRWLRQQPGFASIRVLVLTSSNEVYSVNRAYKLGANSFLVKPSDFENFVELGRIISHFWLRASKAPTVSRPLPEPTPSPPGSGVSAP
ncbi:MAG: two-component system response regulator [Verrucomicrobia bacterium]|nr:MAG: two-component system response regulator [Verrucomicrobiota bacterium]